MNNSIDLFTDMVQYFDATTSLFAVKKICVDYRDCEIDKDLFKALGALLIENIFNEGGFDKNTGEFNCSNIDEIKMIIYMANYLYSNVEILSGKALNKLRSEVE